MGNKKGAIYNRRLTDKQKALEDLAIKKGITRTEAAMQVYDCKNYSSAANVATSNLRKPQVQLYREKHILKAKNKVVQLIDSENEAIALKASDSVLDRTLGKPSQSIQMQSTNTNVNIDMKPSADLARAFVDFLKNKN